MKIATFLAGNNDKHGGYTLIELLVVLVLMVAVMATVAPQFMSSNDRRVLSSESRQIAAALRQVRSEAIANQTESAFVLDLENYSYQIGESRKTSIPQSFTLTLYTGESEVQEMGQGAISFYADGSSSGGEITLSDKNVTKSIVVNWLTGGVVINEGKKP